VTHQRPLDALLVAPGFRKLHPLGMLRLRYQLDFQDERPILEPTRLAELPRAVLVPSWQVIASRGAAARWTSGADPRRALSTSAFRRPKPRRRDGDGHRRLDGSAGGRAETCASAIS
jgi:hypothetical protein